jgi:hypothetical protein
MCQRLAATEMLKALANFVEALMPRRDALSAFSHCDSVETSETSTLDNQFAFCARTFLPPSLSARVSLLLPQARQLSFLLEKLKST